MAGAGRVETVKHLISGKERYLGALILKPDLYDSHTEARLGGQRLSHLHVRDAHIQYNTVSG